VKIAMQKPLGFIQEPARQVPLTGRFDVVVCGAGPAGMAAALSSARQGATTLLLESHGCLGGIWTAGLLCWIIDAGNKLGIMREITRELDNRGARRIKGKNFAYDVEEMKLLLEEMAVNAGIHIQLHTSVVGCRKGVNGRLTTVITESKSGREAWEGKVFIDATGDGDLGALAGCGFDLGHPETGLTQPMSLIGLITGLHQDRITPFIGGGSVTAKANLVAEMRRAGISPSYGSPTLFQIREDLFALMANHAYGFFPTSARDMTQATLTTRAELHRLVRAMRGLGPPWESMRIVATADQIGIREGRRLHGFYQVTGGDLSNGVRHLDAVCRCTFGVDIHTTQPSDGTSYDKSFRVRSMPYDIPMRALVARDVDGLFMAGRCISGDFVAHSSYRVTGNAVAMGESAGRQAAQCALQGVSPWRVAERVLENSYASDITHPVC
jgi:hypothetical protein